MEFDGLKRNILSVTEKVRKAENRVGSRVSIVAATKTISPQMINAAVDLGMTDIGENRVQEYLSKRDAVKPVRWHFIGTLQRNKAKYVVGKVELIQSVSGIELAREIDRIAAKLGVVQSVLAEVNIGGESGKTGAALSDAQTLIEYIQTLKNVRLCGLMTVPPIAADESVYKTAYRIFDTYRDETFNILSVGMSGDYERAIDYGSNMIRLGTAIFGQRDFRRKNYVE